jgi:hypothetical protein
MYQNTIRKFNVISFNIITALCFLLPFFFLPATLGGLAATKAVLLYIGVFLAAALWLVAQFLDGTVKVPWHWAFAALGLWILLTLVSALTSLNVRISLWGLGFSVDSFATVLALGLFTFLIASFARDRRRLVQLFLAAFAGSVLTVFLQIVLYVSQRSHFVSTYLAHVTTQGTLVGSWVDFAYFVIFTFLLGLLMFEVLMPRGFFKILSLVAMVLSLIVLIFLNFTAAWIIAIISALLVFVYKSSVERSISKMFPRSKDDEYEEAEEPQSQHFPLLSFISLLVGLFFFLSSASIGASLAHFAGVSFTDIRPSFVTTTHVMRAELSHNPIFGAGPGRYSNVWDLYHPQSINSTVFWNTSFDNGYNFLQSVLTTNGILPVLFLVALLGLALVHGFQLFSYQFPDRFSRFITVASVVMLVAFICLLLFTAPGLVLIAFGFMYIGLLLGVSSMVGRTPLMSFNFLKDPRTSFFAILLIVIAALAGFSAVYLSANRFVSLVYYSRALDASDQATAELRLDRALALSQNDVYWRTMTQLYTGEFTAAAGQQSPNKTQLQSLFSEAEQSAQSAVSWDPTSASNWLSLSQVYQLVANSQNAQAYTNAKTAADQAEKLNPVNPVFTLNEAQLALTKQDYGTAFNYIAQSLALKPDYLDAYVLKAQIEQAQGDASAPVTELTAYTQVAPFDSQGYLLLGDAQLQAKDYPDAVNAFAQAHALAPTDESIFLQYINTLETAGDTQQAVSALRAFKLEFPSVSGVEQEIQRIESAPSTPASTTKTGSPVTTTGNTTTTKSK